jgi:hypothetical protein
MKSKHKKIKKQSKSTRRRSVFKRRYSRKRKKSIKKQSKSTRRRTVFKHRYSRKKYDGAKNTDYYKKVYELFNRNLISKKFVDNTQLIDSISKDNEFDNYDRKRIYNLFIEIIKKFLNNPYFKYYYLTYYKMYIKLLNQIQLKLREIPPQSFKDIKKEILESFEIALNNRNFLAIDKIISLVIKDPRITTENKKDIYIIILDKLINKGAVIAKYRSIESVFNSLYSLIENILKLRIIDPREEKDKEKIINLFARIVQILRTDNFHFKDTEDKRNIVDKSFYNKNKDPHYKAFADKYHWFHRSNQAVKLLDLLSSYGFIIPLTSIDKLLSTDHDIPIVVKAKI